MKQLSMSRRLALGALLLGAIPGIVVASAADHDHAQHERALRSDPAADMTGDQQMADHERVWAAYLEKYESWLAEVLATDLDLASMERVGLMALPDVPPKSLGDAVRDADAIVVATVEGIEFQPSLTAVVRLRVEQTLKGTVPSPLTVLFAGGPQPEDSEWHGVVLAEMEAAPLLLPGDRAVLLLDLDRNQYFVQVHTGELTIAGAEVTALDTNPARASIEGKDLGQVIDMILAELR